MLDTVLLVAILLVLVGILTAVKAGNEVIKGMQALADGSTEGKNG